MSEHLGRARMEASSWRPVYGPRPRPHLRRANHRALCYRALLVFLSALTLSGLALYDEANQPEMIHRPNGGSYYMRFERPER